MHKELSTSRLKLRQLTLSDKENLFSLRSDEAVNRFLNREVPAKADEVLPFIQKINDGINKKECFYWAIVKKEEDALLGTICLFNFNAEKTVSEIGYELLPEFQGAGIMAEAVKAVIDYAFGGLGIKILVAFTNEININSVRLLLKNNFKPDDKNKYEQKEESQGFICYSLRKENAAYSC